MDRFEAESHRSAKRFYRGRVTAVKLDPTTQIVQYSLTTVGPLEDDYIPLESIKKKKLSSRKAGTLQRLLVKHTWDTRPVVAAEDVIPHEYDQPGHVWYQFKKVWERWIAHRNHPVNDNTLNILWKKIENLIDPQ